MTTTPTVLLAQVIKLVGTIEVAVTDSFSTRTVTLVAAATTRYGRIYLAAAGAAGTSASGPYDILDAFEDALNAAPGAAYWSVRLQASGAVRITYNSTGTGTITWTSTDLRNLLGFTGNLSLAQDAYSTATYAPGGCIVASCADEEDTGWQATPTGVASSETLAGVAVVSDSTHRKISRACTLRLLPFTQAEQTSGERLTPAFPEETTANAARWTTPSATAYYSAAFSAHEFVATVHRIAGAPAAFSIGGLQSLIATSTTTFDVGYVSTETLRGGDLFPHSVPGWYARRDLILRLNRTSRADR